MNRLYTIALLLGFFMLHFQWGNNNAFLLQLQHGLLFENKNTSLLHPLIIVPAIGELLLLFALVRPNKKLILIGLSLLGVLVLFVLFTGIFGKQTKMIVSTAPFIATAVSFIRNYKKLPLN
ncbi:MAG: hypothetical protein QM710_01190 [Flavobacterium sp.]